MNIIDWLFNDSNGKKVTYQRPNLPIIVWFVALLLSKFIDSDNVSNIFSIISFVALLVWALLEVLTGVNRFRRILGLIVITYLVASNIN
jgi:hypothetical protein